VELQHRRADAAFEGHAGQAVSHARGARESQRGPGRQHREDVADRRGRRRAQHVLARLQYVGGIGKDGPEDRGLAERCIANDIGPPITPSFDSNFVQIFQARDHVVLLLEQFHDARTIPLGDRAPLDDEIRGWFGYSRGRWEGDTLVVETRHFNDLTPSFDNAGTAHDKVVIERFTRTSEDTVNYAVTLVDPSTFQDRLEFMVPLVKTDKRVYEFACHEGNYSMEMILGGARREEREALQAKK
jgi:hypothetical protein